MGNCQCASTEHQLLGTRETASLSALVYTDFVPLPTYNPSPVALITY